MAKVEHDHEDIQRILGDDRPIALRKRPRAVANKIDTTVAVTTNVVPSKQEPKTPTKAAKKVRFSDPGPAIDASTGLTPHLGAMEFSNSVGPLRRVNPVWPSTPSVCRSSRLFNVDAAAGPENSLNVQFSSLRQILNPRVKRQIARKDLSVEMNAIGDEKKLISQQGAEIQTLRHLISLQQMQAPADKTYIEDSQLQLPDFSMNVDLPDLDKELSSIADSPGGDRDTTASCSEYDSHDSTGIFIGPDGDEEYNTRSKLTHSLLGRYQFSTIDQFEQAQLSNTQLEDHIATQTAHLTEARLKLERIFPGETTLPLVPTNNGDCAPLLNAMIQHLQNAELSIGTMKKAAANAEMQRQNLQGNFNQALGKIEYAQKHYNILRDGAREGEAANERARKRISILEDEVEDSNRSAKKLREALDKYRIEVHALEDLITRLEAEGKIQMEEIRTEMTKRILDVETTLLRETQDRLTIEEELETSGLQIQMFQSSEKELKEALSEKQAIVRSLEEQLFAVKTGSEQEVGFLNVKIARLEQELASARIAINSLEIERNHLRNELDRKHQQDLTTVGQLRNEIRTALQNIEDIVGNLDDNVSHQNSTTRSMGLITPSIDGGRFRDVAMDTVNGAVEVARGRSRRSRNVDSAIGISDEDMMDV